MCLRLIFLAQPANSVNGNVLPLAEVQYPESDRIFSSHSWKDVWTQLGVVPVAHNEEYATILLNILDLIFLIL